MDSFLCGMTPIIFMDSFLFYVEWHQLYYIGSDTGSGSADLITDDRFVLAFKIFDKV